jgi:hypothetical protein
MIDGDREPGRPGIVTRDHRRQSQPPGNDRVHGHAELPASLADHEVDGLRRDGLRRGEKIAFVLAILGIEYDDRAAGDERVESFVEAGKARLRHGGNLGGQSG